MKKLRVLLFAIGLALPMLGGAAVNRHADSDRSVVEGSAPSAWCWICFGSYCYWLPC